MPTNHPSVELLVGHIEQSGEFAQLVIGHSGQIRLCELAHHDVGLFEPTMHSAVEKPAAFFIEITHFHGINI